MKITSLIKTDYPLLTSNSDICQVRKTVADHDVAGIIEEDNFLGLITHSELAKKNYRTSLDLLNDSGKIDMNSAVFEALDMMNQEKTDALSVYENGSLKGIILKNDIIKLLADISAKTCHTTREILHDLKNPLYAIEAITSLLDKAGIDEDTKELIHYQRKALRSALSIIGSSQSLLANQAEQTEELGLTALIQDLLEAYAGIIKMKNFSLSVKEKLRLSKKRAVVSMAKKDISRIFDNLFINAFKFTSANGRISIRIGQRKINEKFWPYFILSDSGIGMPAEIRNILFSASPKVMREGIDGQKPSGLGLHITRNLLEKNGYSIEIKSLENKGTAAIVRFYQK